METKTKHLLRHFFIKKKSTKKSLHLQEQTKNLSNSTK